MEKVENIFVEIVLKLTPDCKSQKTGKNIGVQSGRPVDVVARRVDYKIDEITFCCSNN